MVVKIACRMCSAGSAALVYSILYARTISLKANMLGAVFVHGMQTALLHDRRMVSPPGNPSELPIRKMVSVLQLAARDVS